MKLKNLFIIGAVFLFFSCEEDSDIDKEKPVINIDFAEAFPVNCDTLYFGETFEIKVRLTDNVELGSITALSIDIHNNFDHHSHSTEVNECSLNDVKDPINPYVIIQSFDLPEGQSSYETAFEITLPEGDENGSFDKGDYHFFIRLTDKEGWSAQKGLSVKMLHR